MTVRHFIILLTEQAICRFGVPIYPLCLLCLFVAKSHFCPIPLSLGNRGIMGLGAAVDDCPRLAGLAISATAPYGTH